VAVTPLPAFIATRAFRSHGSTFAKGDVVSTSGYSDSEYARLVSQGLLSPLMSASVLVAGAVSDSAFSAAPPNGTMGYDTTNHKIYVRDGGSWKATAALT